MLEEPLFAADGKLRLVPSGSTDCSDCPRMSFAIVSFACVPVSLEF